MCMYYEYVKLSAFTKLNVICSKFLLELNWGQLCVSAIRDTVTVSHTLEVASKCSPLTTTPYSTINFHTRIFLNKSFTKVKSKKINVYSCVQLQH